MTSCDKTSNLPAFILGEPNCLERGLCRRVDNESICSCNPGFADEDCSRLVCVGEPMCKNHGKTNLSKP